MPVDAFAIASAFAVRNPAHEHARPRHRRPGHGQAGHAVDRTHLVARCAAPRADRGAQRQAHLAHFHADHGGAPLHGGTRHRLPADDREGRRHAGPGRARGAAPHRDGAVRAGCQPRRRLMAVRPPGLHHVRHGRHHDRSGRPARRAAAGGRAGRRGRRLAHHGEGHRRQDHRPRRRQRDRASGSTASSTVGPQRVAPVSLLASRYPEVIAMLEADLADTEGGSLHGKLRAAALRRHRRCAGGRGRRRASASSSR